MKSDVTEESIETVVDKVSDEAVSELMDEVENQNSLRTGETINSMVSKNQGTTFNIGGHVNAKFKGIVDMGVNTNFNTTSQTNDTLTKTANVERFAQSIEKSVSKQVYKKNTERELTISNRRMTSEERTQKNIQERESTNSSGRYALDVDTHQAAQVYESILKLDDVIIMIGNGIKTLSLDDYEALRDYVPASVFENIKLAIENFAVRLYNDQIVHPFKDGLKNPDDKTQEQFKYGLPLTRRQYAMRLNGIKKFSKLARGNDVENPSHMDEYQEQLMENRIKREEKALEMDDVEIKKRAAEVDEIVMKNTYMQKIIDSEHMDNPLTVFPLSMALFNNSNVPSKMYMMDKVPDSIVKQINQIGYKKE
jgi:hypothetical protein